MGLNQGLGWHDVHSGLARALCLEVFEQEVRIFHDFSDGQELLSPVEDDRSDNRVQCERLGNGFLLIKMACKG